MNTNQKPHRKNSRAAEKEENKRVTITHEPSEEGLAVLQEWDKTGYARTYLIDYLIKNSNPEERQKLETTLRMCGVKTKKVRSFNSVPQRPVEQMSLAA